MDDCDCDCGVAVECCLECCSCLCEVCLKTDADCPCIECCAACSCSRSTAKCCCRFITALTFIAVSTLVVMLVVAYAAVPARVAVEDAHLSRFALTNGTALAYDVSLAIAVRNRNFATGVWKTAPLDAELRFHGQTFARARAKLESAEWGLSKERGKGVYRVTAADTDRGRAPAVALGGDAVAEFVRESVAGVFAIELVVVGGDVKYEEGRQHHGSDDSSVRVTCLLKLEVPTATKAAARFTCVKCS